jgi:CDP-diacylglycerol--serine O-phosphatidyltransferase
MRNWIPNCLTAFNLILGVFAIISTFNGEPDRAAFFIIAAMISDGMDGRVARYLKVSSEFGKELDSLCDLVSFGVAPAILAYVFLLKDFGFAGYMVAAFFAVCGAIRLARFNVNTSVVKGHFMGLPIPAGGCVLATFIMLGIKPEGWIFPLMVCVFAYLMVSTIKYPDFKGKGEKFRMLPALICLGIGIYILILSREAVFFVPFFVYVLFGIFNAIFALFDRNQPA